jgi:energy-coupling factor transporter transmembrane protein EcfT
MMIFLGLLFFMHLNFTEGTPLPPFPQWYITPTYEGLYRGMRITWDFVLLLISAAVLTRTTSPTETVRGIEGLLRPLGLLGIPSHDIAIMIAIALRFVPVFLEEIERIKEAQMARGAEFKTGTLLQRTKAAIGMLTPLIVGFARRADELAIAMEARGYSRGLSRTYMTELRISRTDYGAMGIMILITGAHIFVRHILGT